MCVYAYICMYVFVYNILEKRGAKGINDAKTPLYKYQTSINLVCCQVKLDFNKEIVTSSKFKGFL